MARKTKNPTIKKTNFKGLHAVLNSKIERKNGSGEYQKHGLFLAKEGKHYIAIDNKTGDAWTEYFKTKKEAKIMLLFYS